ncbi:hypothetical protein GGI12_000219 [Dipsacomyces acuminosporus]|nr:hypothetical protein GGI12_000219 [Dipsacomyces acuminosporus]
MREPSPRRSKFSKFYIGKDDVDYNMKSPLGSKIKYPCRGFAPGPIQGTLVAGQDFKVFFDGTATRQGGDCQFAISYDNGISFAVLWDKLGNCFLDTVNGGYEVPIPEKLPAAGEAVFAWTWIPSLGKREYFMNCADVRIQNYGQQEKYIGKELLVVNLPGKEPLPPKQSDGDDPLNSMLEKRPLITVGSPTESAGAATPAPEENKGVEHVNRDQANVEEEAPEEGAPEEDQDTVVHLVHEQLSLTTDVVFVTKFVTESDTETESLYTYGHDIQTRGRSTEATPPSWSVSGTNVGMSIADMTSASNSPQASTDDAVASKTTGAESLDFIPPSMMLPHAAQSRSRSSADLWPSGDQPPTSLGSDFVPSAGSSPHDSKSTHESAAEAGTAFSDINALSQTIHSATTNRPSLKSVLKDALSRSGEILHPSSTTATLFSTVTVNGRPMLQVVVSANNPVTAESLTLSYSA